MKIRTKEKIAPIHVMPDDTITLHNDGKEIMTERIGRKMTLNEAVIFDVESGDFGDDVKDGIGGAFLETEAHYK